MHLSRHYKRKKMKKSPRSFLSGGETNVHAQLSTAMDECHDGICKCDKNEEEMVNSA